MRRRFSGDRSRRFSTEEDLAANIFCPLRLRDLCVSNALFTLPHALSDARDFRHRITRHILHFSLFISHFSFSEIAIAASVHRSVLRMAHSSPLSGLRLRPLRDWRSAFDRSLPRGAFPKTWPAPHSRRRPPNQGNLFWIVIYRGAIRQTCASPCGRYSGSRLYPPSHPWRQ